MDTRPFLIIDSQVYHLCASFKDLGQKLLAFSKMKVGNAVIIRRETSYNL